MQVDTIYFEILEDGTVRTKTAGVSGVNHARADSLVKDLGRVLGGDTVIQKRPRNQPVAHSHTHTHTHDQEVKS